MLRFSFVSLLIHWLPFAGALVAGMAINLQRSANKLQTRGQAAGKDFTDGVTGSGQKWQANTAAAEENWAAGVNQAVADKRFGRGVQRTSPSDFETKTKTVGAQRFTQGISSAGPAWEKGFAPIASAMDGVALPPRRPRGDPSNIQRVAAMNTAARQAKLSR